MFRNYSKYEVYEDGRIWSYKTNKFLKPATLPNGYQQVALSDNEDKIKWYRLNRLVYEAVTGEPIPEGLQVNHINENKADNRFENLNLMTPKENINYGTCLERRSATRSKTVGAFKDGELIMSFKSIEQAHRNGFNRGHISECCNGKLQHHKGFEWKYIK